MRLMHITLYNEIRNTIKEKNFVLAEDLAHKLLFALQDSMSSYGWKKLPLSGNEQVDRVIRVLDKYLTGERLTHEIAHVFGEE